MQLTFHGAARTVTGSQHLLRINILVHGEETSAVALKEVIEERFKLKVIVPERGQCFDL